MSVCEDAQARRAAVLFEVAAVADRYEQDRAAEDEGADVRLANILNVADRMYALGAADVDTRTKLEMAGRLLAWLEVDAAQEQQR